MPFGDITMITVPQSMIEENMFGMSNDGVCIECGEFQGGCEPDAVGYECESCGAKAVWGLEEALICGLIILGE